MQSALNALILNNASVTCCHQPTNTYVHANAAELLRVELFGVEMGTSIQQWSNMAIGIIYL